MWQIREMKNQLSCDQSIAKETYHGNINLMGTAKSLGCGVEEDVAGQWFGQMTSSHFKNSPSSNSLDSSPNGLTSITRGKSPRQCLFIKPYPRHAGKFKRTD
ncbi:unnamed protein product [Leuciscus chuanchicus]